MPGTVLGTRNIATNKEDKALYPLELTCISIAKHNCNKVNHVGMKYVFKSLIFRQVSLYKDNYRLLSFSINNYNYIAFWNLLLKL